MKTGKRSTPKSMVLLVGLLVLARRLFRCAPRPGAGAGSLSTPCRRDSSRDPARDGATGGERQRRPDGLRAGRERSIQGSGKTVSGTRPVLWMSHQAGGGALAFRFHLPRATDARRQGVRPHEGHGPGGKAAQSPDLFCGPSSIGNQPGRPAKPCYRPRRLERRHRRERWSVQRTQCPGRFRLCHRIPVADHTGPVRPARRIRTQLVSLGAGTNRLRRPGPLPPGTWWTAEP